MIIPLEGFILINISDLRQNDFEIEDLAKGKVKGERVNPEKKCDILKYIRHKSSIIGW